MTRRLVIVFLCLLTGGVGGQLNGANPGRGPQRIVSLGPAITERLYALGAGDRLYGITLYCRQPPGAAPLARVGNVTHVNLERIVRLRPDLVIATAMTDPRVVSALRRTGVRVEAFPEPRSFGELNRQFIDLGGMIGEEENAKVLVEEAEKRVKGVADRVRAAKKVRVFCQIGARPLFAAVSGTLLNDLIERAGGTNIASASRIGFYSREEVVRQDPDVILIVTMGVAGGNEKRTWQKLTGMEAVRKGRIHVMDAYSTCSPTPLSFAGALADFAEAMHPAVPDAKEPQRMVR